MYEVKNAFFNDQKSLSMLFPNKYCVETKDKLMETIIPKIICVSEISCHLEYDKFILYN